MKNYGNTLIRGKSDTLGRQWLFYFHSNVKCHLSSTTTTPLVSSLLNVPLSAVLPGSCLGRSKYPKLALKLGNHFLFFSEQHVVSSLWLIRLSKEGTPVTGLPSSLCAHIEKKWGRPFENRIIWNPTFKKFGIRLVGFQIPTVNFFFPFSDIKPKEGDEWSYNEKTWFAKRTQVQ